MRIKQKNRNTYNFETNGQNQTLLFVRWNSSITKI